VTLQTHHTFQS